MTRAAVALDRALALALALGMVSGAARATDLSVTAEPRFGDLAISGRPETATVPAGGTARFTMTGKNRGGDAMRDVVAAADVWGATIADAPPECSIRSAIVSCRWPDLPPGATMTSTIELKSVGYSARASLSIRSSDADTDASNNDLSLPFAVVLPPRPPVAPNDADLAFSRFHLPVVNAGDAFSLEATVENYGPAAASNVRIVFPRRNDLILEEITSPYAMSCALFGEFAGCRLPTMPAGGRVTLTLHLRASGGLALLSSPGGGLTPNYVPSYFTGQVTSDSHDPDLENNSARDMVAILYPPDPPDPSFGAGELRFRRGDLARYTIRVVSSGGDIEVEHAPPPGIQIISASSTNGSCSAGPTIVCKGRKLIDSSFEVAVLAVATTPGTWDVEAKARLNGQERSAHTRVTVTAPMRRGVGQ